MVALCVTSLDEGAGKTTVCAGVGRHLLSDAKKVGFLKPIVAGNLPAEGVDSDALFMKEILALEEPADLLCPVISDQKNLGSKIKQAYAKVSSGKDVVIIEGPSQREIVEALKARVIIVEGYSSELSTAKLTDSCQDFGEYLLGVVVNKVPRSQAARISAQFVEAGINILGMLPESRTLFGLTIGELAEHVQGEILNSTDKSAELVENFMLGAMTIDPGPVYFGRKTNKAAVIRGERPDMQLAALETPTKCLVLTGNTAPTSAVLHRAEDKGVPIILAKGDTMATVAGIEDALSKNRFNQERKLPGLGEIMEQHLNFQAIYSGLGLGG